MAREFEIRREVQLFATADQVWNGVTSGTAGWMWPIEYEPRVGGTTDMGGTVTSWDPPHHFAVHAEGPDGWYNNLDYVIEDHGVGGALLRYVHSGIFASDWDTQYDGASRHTDFYLDALGQYVKHFGGRTASYLSIDAPEPSLKPEAVALLRRGLGITDSTALGESLTLSLPGLAPVDAFVDYLDPHFTGLRSADALYRFFGRDAWGMPMSLSIHVFSDPHDNDAWEQAWHEWFGKVYG